MDLDIDPLNLESNPFPPHAYSLSLTKLRFSPLCTVHSSSISCITTLAASIAHNTHCTLIILTSNPAEPT